MSAGPGAVSGPAESRGTEEPQAVAGAPPGSVPGPAEGPAVPILVYDGDCAFCSRWAQVAERLGTSAEAVPWQGIDLGDALGVTARPVQHEVLWVAPDGDVSGGSRAVAHLLMDVGGPWRLVGRLLHVPPLSWAAHGLYRVVADYGHWPVGDRTRSPEPPVR